MMDKQYCNQARIVLMDFFPDVSCAAVDAVCRSHKYSLKDSFHFLKITDAKRGTTVGDGRGLFGVCSE